MRILIILLFIIQHIVAAQTFRQFLETVSNTPIAQRHAAATKYLEAKTTPLIENDTTAVFIWYGKADTVRVNGNYWTNWSRPQLMQSVGCGESTLFYLSCVFPKDLRMDYMIVADGRYMTDPRNPVTTPSGFGPHSEIRMPHSTHSPYLTEQKNIAKGTIDTLVIPSNDSSIASRTVKIYLPAGYDKLSSLPSVYVHDGFEAISFAFLPTVLDNLIAQKKIPPVIALFIPPVERQSEYVGEKRDAFVRYIAEVVVPAIDSRYRTSRSKADRGMMGISNGGHISFYAVASRPDLFTKIGGQSSTITDVMRALFFLKSNEVQKMKIYFDCGRYDIQFSNPQWGDVSFLESNRSFRKEMLQRRIPHRYREFNDGHEWANWRERMPEILEFFFSR